MKVDAIISWVIFLIFFLCQAGCEHIQLTTEPASKTEQSSDVSLYTPYAPDKVDIMPFTGLVGLGSTEQLPQVNIYVSLLDSFGSQIKAPGIFRFEVYEYVRLSSEPFGKRIAIWPDVDLTIAAENNKYWQDFLRAYRFNLPFEPGGSQSYILLVTFLSPTGRRLSDEFIFKRTK